jgi:uncharacterized protein
MDTVLTTAGHFLRQFWNILGEMSPYLLFGFAVAGILKVLVPVSFVERHLGGRGFWQPVKAALVGVPLPLCSCSVIPVSAALRRSGAGKGATTSFLLSAPQTGVDSIAVTYSLLGPLFAIYRVVVAFASGILGGWLVDLGTRRERLADSHVDDCECSTCAPEAVPPSASLMMADCADASCGCGNREFVPEMTGPADIPIGSQRLRAMLRYGFVTLPRDIGPSLMIGLLLAGLLGALVPPHFFHQYLGSGIWPMLLMAGIGIPLYICATASVPVAAALMAAGVSPGAALVFLICGPATNAATITTLWKFLGRGAALIYLGTVFLGSLLAGLVLDLLYVKTNTAQIAHQHELLPVWFSSLCAVALLVIVAHANWPRRGNSAPKSAAEAAPTMENSSSIQPIVPATVLAVGGMTCNHCRASVERALREQPGVEEVDVDLQRGLATVRGSGLDAQGLAQAVTRLGYAATVK